MARHRLAPGRRLRREPSEPPPAQPVVQPPRASRSRSSANKSPLAEHLLRFPPLRGMTDPRLEGLVFCGEHRGLVRRHVFRPVWERACSAVGIEGVRPEWLRHTGASFAYAATRDMKAVAQRLGHTSTRMMDTVYLELYADASASVADAIDELVKRSTGDA
jgi:integrase